MFRSRVPALCLTAALITVGACHHAPPVGVPTAAGPNADSIAAARAREAAARAEQARLDSIARAQAARDAAAAEASRRQAAAAAAARAAMDALTARVMFDYDKDVLRPDAQATLESKVPVLQTNREIRIRIEGNTDERGSDEYNLALGQRRAAAAKRYLVTRGIEEGRIDIVSYGEERPSCSNGGDDNCWRQNRRDEFIVTAGTISPKSSADR